MNCLILFLFFFTCNLKAQQEETTQTHQTSTSLPTENNVEKESLPPPSDNTEPSPQSAESIDNKMPLPLESNAEKESLSSHSDSKEEEAILKPDKNRNKEILSSSETNENTEKPAQKLPFSIELEAEGSLTKNLISKNQKSFYPDIPYIALSFEYDILSNLQFFTELEFGSKKNLWNMDLEQVGLFYRSNKFDLKAGLIPISLGYSYANSNMFTKPLSFYKLLRDNPMDIGLRLTVPLYKEHLSFTISRFKGYLKRTFDNHYKSPEFAPLIVSFKGTGLSWNGFITYLKQDLAFKEPLNASGGGFTFKTSLTSQSLISIQGEIWGSKEKHQSSLSYYLFPKLSFKKYELGVLFGGIKNFVPNFQKSETTSSIYEWILQGSYELFPGVFLIGERFITKQKKGPLLNNLWALRLKTRLEF